MEALSKIKLPELAQPKTEVVSLATISQQRLPEGMGLSLTAMMAQAQSAKPNQTLPKGTPDMFLIQWEAIALRYGIETFGRGLLKALREQKFFPDPQDIEAQCAAIARYEQEREAGRAAVAEVDRLREQWERERAEDGALPPAKRSGYDPYAIAQDAKAGLNAEDRKRLKELIDGGKSKKEEAA